MLKISKIIIYYIISIHYSRKVREIQLSGEFQNASKMHYNLYR